jgi:hypothetical protein
MFRYRALPVPCQGMGRNMVLPKPVRHIKNSVLFLAPRKFHQLFPYILVTKVKNYCNIISNLVLPEFQSGSPSSAACATAQ